MTSSLNFGNDKTNRINNETQPLKKSECNKNSNLQKITQVDVKKAIVDVVNSHITAKRSFHTKEEIENLFNELREVLLDEKFAEFFRNPNPTLMSELFETILFRIGRAMGISFGSFSLKNLIIYGLKERLRDPKYQLAIYGVGGVWTGVGETAAAKLAEKIMQVSIDPIPESVKGSYRLGVFKNELLFTSVAMTLWYSALFVLAGAYNAKEYPRFYSDNPLDNPLEPMVVSMIASPLAASFYGLTQAVTQLQKLDKQMKSVCTNGEINYPILGSMVKGMIYSLTADKHGCEEKLPGLMPTLNTSTVGGVFNMLLVGLAGYVMYQHDEGADLWTREKTGMKDEAIGVAILLFAYAFVVQLVSYLLRPQDDEVVNDLIDEYCSQKSLENSKLDEDIESQNDEQINLIDKDQISQTDMIKKDSIYPLSEDEKIPEEMENSPRHRYMNTLRTWHATHEYRSIGMYKFKNENGEENLIEMSENFSGDSVVPMMNSGDRVPKMDQYTYKDGMYIHKSLLNKTDNKHKVNNNIQGKNTVEIETVKIPKTDTETVKPENNTKKDSGPLVVSSKNELSKNEPKTNNKDIVIRIGDSEKEEKIDKGMLEEHFEYDGDIVFIVD